MNAPNAVPDEERNGLSERLRVATRDLTGGEIAPRQRIGIAVSGGADSMALLDCAALLWPGQVSAATVDHGLRPEAAEEADMVRAFSERIGIPHVTLGPDQPITGSVQASARTVRYALLESWRGQADIDWLMTAHHGDDQIETVLMRLSRGAGVSGLAGIRAKRGTILRPLLGERRATLRAWCVARGVPFVDDPSNSDPRFDRARLRKLISDREIIDPTGVMRATGALAEANDALGWMEEHLFAAHVQEIGGVWTLERTDLPREMMRRLLLRMLMSTNGAAENPRGPSIDQAVVQLFQGKRVALADCIVTGGSTWTVRRAPPRRSV
ncbi:tRNA lysidine(34) synthetase TilS [Sphingobium sp. CR28]|uniref:tRNA lysidine(34) synthetase TilS n=1 Tax=Sphingobium sp. CR28 TaxID=3400272 RepID=UPI003FF02238